MYMLLTCVLFCVCVCVVSESVDLAEAVRTVLKQEISRLFGESNPQSFNKNYLSQHSKSIPHRLAGTLHTHTRTHTQLPLIQETSLCLLNKEKKQGCVGFLMSSAATSLTTQNL